MSAASWDGVGSSVGFLTEHHRGRVADNYEVVVTDFSCTLCAPYTYQVHRAVCPLLALKPHTRGLQVPASGQTVPDEAPGSRPSVGNGHSAPEASVVPKSAARNRRAVSWVRVVITVVRREHHAVVIPSECVGRVSREIRHHNPVVIGLGQDSECAVLGVVPVAGVATWLQVEPELVAAGQSQLTE